MACSFVVKREIALVSAILADVFNFSHSYPARYQSQPSDLSGMEFAEGFCNGKLVHQLPGLAQLHSRGPALPDEIGQAHAIVRIANEMQMRRRA